MDEAFLTADLKEVGFAGPRFTWCNNQPGIHRILIQLDRTLYNSEGRELIPLVRVRHLNCIDSDHCPIFLSLVRLSPPQQKQWIKFEDTWLTYPSVRGIVHKQWCGADSGTPSDVLKWCCLRTIRALSFWSRNKITGLERSKNQLEAEVVDLQAREGEAADWTEDPTAILVGKVKELSAMLSHLNTWWKHRAKVHWVQQGDANTAYFHAMASSHRRTNHISHVAVSDMVVSEDPDEVSLIPQFL
ncbi:hypothetical protein KSP39_PZI013983 [Platanthera zijinensis]|uniref:Endonuclease/exonuclease/phosphatase domain-containing protein n=1 Tax=Platanthera zijinensis TaxID=2320716 RepID=A0AAP0G329_9ASPA